MQFFASPLHLTGYDIYNRPDAGKDRIPGILKEFPKTLFMRIVRVIPAYIIGPLVNAELKEFYHGMIEGKDWKNNSE